MRLQNSFGRLTWPLFIFSFFGLVTPLDAQNPGAVPKKWWKETTFYEIYMPSYADSNSDGRGDFPGITTKLDYLQNLGIKGIWLTPFLESPKVDNGYDVSDYYRVDPAYGTQQDFENFLAEAHQRGIKVIMDLVLNHSSTEHFWFQEARKSKDNPYRDYYIWRDEPNNWESFFGGTAWQKDELTGQSYYHKFDVRMADLNWANQKLRAEIQKILRHWLLLGVDGFRLDVINFLSTDGILADNPTENGSQKHQYDIDQSGVMDAMRMIRSTANEFPDRFLVGEIGSDKLEILKRYQGEDLLDVVFNFNFGSIPEFSVERIFVELKAMEAQQSGYPTLFFGSHDMPRLMDRLASGDKNRALALAALMLTAKGVPFVYFGEEIGMRNFVASDLSEIVDIQGRTQYDLALKKGMTPEEALLQGNKHNRDKSRSPMQWDASANAGFSKTKPWIGIPPGYQETNVAAMDGKAGSMLQTYRKLLELRNSEKALQYGSYAALEREGSVIRCRRIYGSEVISVVINFGTSELIEKVPSGSKILLGNSRIGPDSFLIYKLP